jgi:3-oxoacyl-[acyl-carrier protein] reductase
LKEKIMDLKIKNKLFIVGGAGAGFGRAISEALAREGAEVVAISRTEDKLIGLKRAFPDNIEYLCSDITLESTQNKVLEKLNNRLLSGVIVNAGGPPAGGFFEIDMEQWEEAWKSVVKWKISFTQKLIPLFQKQQYGRLLYIESVSIKQPVENLILSNALRPAVLGFVKTLSQEVAREGITANILAPGSHATAALHRLFVKKSELEGISIEQAKMEWERSIPVGKMAEAKEITGIALYLLSPLSRYITGQTITHDGGSVKGIFG